MVSKMLLVVVQRSKKMEKNIHIANYYKNVSTLLPIRSRNEKKYLNGFKKNLEEFSNEMPNASYKDIVDEFGEPKDVVISYLNNCNEDYLISKLKIRTIVFRTSVIITVIAICLCLVYSYLFTVGYNEAKQQRMTNTETTITEE